MTTKKLLIAKVLPLISNINQLNNNKLIDLKFEKDFIFDEMDNCFDDNMSEFSDSSVSKPKRKRQRLDHLSEEEKLKRRYNWFDSLFVN